MSSFDIWWEYDKLKLHICEAVLEEGNETMLGMAFYEA